MKKISDWAWINKQIHYCLWDVIIHPCSTFKGGWTKLTFVYKCISTNIIMMLTNASPRTYFLFWGLVRFISIYFERYTLLNRILTQYNTHTSISPQTVRAELLTVAYISSVGVTSSIRRQKWCLKNEILHVIGQWHSREPSKIHEDRFQKTVALIFWFLLATPPQLYQSKKSIVAGNTQSRKVACHKNSHDITTLCL